MKFLFGIINNGFLELRVHPDMKPLVIRTIFIVVLILIFESRCLIHENIIK